MSNRTRAALCISVALTAVGCGPSEQAKKQAEQLNKLAEQRAARGAIFYIAFGDAEKAITGRDQEGLAKAVGNLKEQGERATVRLVEIAKDPTRPKQDRLTALVVLGEMNQRTEQVLDVLREVSENEGDVELKNKASEVLAKLSGKS
ncbi:MAG: hypothetical protein L0Z62_43555 [Gemmataceae bacterium]|nr:hypothetical protein [Gemmataceae bacterium]